VAVVLSGCGVLDGSEIHESVSILVHLSRAGVEARMFAPDIDQADVINHVKGSGAGMFLFVFYIICLFVLFVLLFVFCGEVGNTAFENSSIMWSYAVIKVFHAKQI
jgi:hypothetical protein